MSITVATTIASAPYLNTVFDKTDNLETTEQRLVEWEKWKACIDSVVSRINEVKKDYQEGFTNAILDNIEERVLETAWPDSTDPTVLNTFNKRDLKILFWLLNEVSSLICWAGSKDGEFIVSDFTFTVYIPQFKIHDMDTNLPPKVRVSVEIKQRVGRYLTRAEYVSNQLMTTGILLENKEGLDSDTVKVLNEFTSLVEE